MFLPLNLFLPCTVTAARRRSGAPSKVYQWLGPMWRHRTILQIAKFGLDSQNQSPLTESSFETEQHIENLKHVAEG